MKYIRALVLLCTLISSVHGSRNQFIQKYSVAPEIAHILDKHSSIVAKKIDKIHYGRKQHGVWQFDWLPGYYVKYGLARIEGMERIKRCISRYNLDGLTVPDKKIYHIKGRSKSLSSENYAVVVKAVDETPDKKPLTLEQVKQLCTVIHKADYVDMTSTNYIRTTDGKLTLIDTEGIFNREKLIKGFLRMIGTRHNLNTDYEEPALKHLFGEVKQILLTRPDLVEFALRMLNSYFKEQQKPYSWDYVSYCNELFAEFSPDHPPFAC